MHWHYFAAKKLFKTVAALILILLIAAVQLPIRSYAGQKLVLVQLSGMDRQALAPLVNSMEASGFSAEILAEEDFKRSGPGTVGPYVVVPLARQVNEGALSAFSRYISGGGKVVLIPPESFPNLSVKRLFQLVGVEISGSKFAPEPMALNWKGKTQTASEQLPSGSNVLAIARSTRMTVLATWGNDYPAVVTTERGGVLNWQWGKQLSPELNAGAIRLVLPPAPLQPVTEPVAARHAPAESAQPLVTKPAANFTPPATVPQATPVAQSASHTSKAAGPDIARITKLPPVKAVRGMDPQFTYNPAIAASNLKKAATAPTASPSIPETRQPVKGGQVSRPTAPRQVSNNPDDEVLQNILGGESESNGKPSNPPTAQPEGQTAPSRKPFSFLDPEAAAVLAPEFDYGLYSKNMRVLDDYKRRIQDALETSRQLSLNFPTDRVAALLNEADEHKREFEKLYLSNQTQQGLDEYAIAKRLTLQALALTTTSPKVEGRAIWLDRGTILESGGEAGLRQLIRKLSQAGINVVFFETVNAGFPIYPSRLTRSNPLVSGWDPLKVAVDEGHKLGMEVHAWVWTFAVGNKRHNELIGKPVDYAGPILEDSGLMSEALRNQQGGLSVDNKQNEYWLSPASPKGRAFLLDLYKEIVTNYDVDGLQLDYIRYPFQSGATRMGYEQVGRDAFYNSTGQSLDSMDDYKAKMWIAWKTYQVTSFVQQVSETLRAVRPNIKLSAAVFPMRRESRIVAIQQDWETWIDNGWIDILNPMSYTRDPERLQAIYDYVKRSPQKHVMIYPGIAIRNLDAGELVMELEALRDHGGLGSTLFAGAHLDAEKATTLGSGPFKDHTSIPPHRDVVKSLKTVLADYDQKFSRLQSSGALNAVPPTMVQSIQRGLDQLAAILDALTPAHPETAKVAQARQQFTALKNVTRAWSQQDRQSHPFRAQYFDKTMLMMEHLLGFLTDRAGLYGSVAGETPPKSPADPSYTIVGTPASDDGAATPDEMPVPN